MATATPTTSRMGSCPAWCDAPHDDDSATFRLHLRRAPLHTERAQAWLTWDEGITGSARFLAGGPSILLATEAGNRLRLTASEARRLAEILTELGVDDVAGLLRDAADLIGGAR